MARTAVMALPHRRARDARRRHPAAQEPSRRSARLQGIEPPAIDLPARVVARTNRVTKSKPAPRFPKPEKQDCNTCARTLSASSFPMHVTGNCEHPITICKTCLKTWIATQLDNTTYDKLSCPECPEILQNSDVKKHAAKLVYQRFDELEQRGIAESTPGWRWCLSPTCRAGQVHASPQNNAGEGIKIEKIKKEDLEEDICECHECGAIACVPCDRPYHTDETCAEFQKRLEDSEQNEKATLKTIAKECKKCPSCNKNIQRNGGCDYMQCTQCRTEFCFLCLTTYAIINKTGHAQDCIYARPGRIDVHAANAPINGGANNAGANVGRAVPRVFALAVGGLQIFHPQR